MDAGLARSPHPLIDRIVERTASVCVVGQGYVGLSVAAAAVVAGMDVVGVDLDGERVQGLADGRLVVPGVKESVFVEAYHSGRIRFTTDAAAAAGADVTLICVPTPVLEHRPDLSAVEAAGRAVAPHVRPGDLVILESTSYPGTTEQVLLPLLESSGLRAGTDFLLAYSPERIDPGNPKFDLANTPRVVGGITGEATEAAATFYAQLVDEVMTVSSCRAAEMAKLLENTFRMVNIALVNELAVLCWEQDIEPWEVIDAAASKPFGYMPFYPGPGVGGHCIPLDPAYLAWQSRRDTGRPYRLVELAQDINAEMPSYVASRIAEALNDRGRPLKGARILALGVTYKEDIGDTRESAAIQVLARLHRKGAHITFHDPFIERIEEHGLRIERVELNRQAFEGVDLVALLTPHAGYDLPWIVGRSPLLFDARNAVRVYRRDNVVVL